MDPLTPSKDSIPLSPAATGQQMLNYGGTDCLFSFFFFLAPNAKFIKIPTCMN